MFSLAFLEVKSLTKISDTKSAKDGKIGVAVVAAILISYLAIYLVLLASNASIDQKEDALKQQFIVAAYNMFVTMPNPFPQSTSSAISPQYGDRSQMSIFDMYYILTSVMLLCQAVVYLQIARENLIIFIEEHINQKLSKNLDWKNRGMETKSKQLK